MDIKHKAKEELENRIKRIEDFIAEKGVGSSALAKAKKAQRNLNLALVAGSIFVVAGLTIWAFSGGNDEDEA